ncbi:MAG: DUF1552 domain-containing protein [Verrucomicrobiales bacterium]
MINRRTFFRGATLGLGGLYLAPFIRQLEAAGGQPAPRVLFFIQGNGVYPNEIQPAGIERPNNPDKLEDRPLAGHELPESLRPLAPWAGSMTLLHGLSGRIARGSHNSGFAALGCWPMQKRAFGETVDAALANRLGGIFPHVGLGVTNKPASIDYNLTASAKGAALPTLMNPVLAHRQYFAAGAAGAARKEFDVDTSLLDFMADDVRRMRARLDGSEREKLDRYLGAFEAMSGRQSKLAAMADRIAQAAPAIDPKLGDYSDTRTGPTGVFDRLEAQFQIAAGIMVAGLSNAITVSAGAGPDKIGLSCLGTEVGAAGGYVGSHSIGHGASLHGKSSGEWHALIRKACLEKLAGFLRTLESVPEGGGTMLDNTLVVYLSDSAEGHHPRCEEWPFVLIGDLGGRLRLGDRYLRYPWYGMPGHRTIASLYLSLLHAAGDRRAAFGIDDVNLRDLDQSGPLAEIMV